MSVPKRIQRKRTKGWRMPDGAVYVGRGTEWGNPWRVGDALMTETPSTDEGAVMVREFVLTPDLAVALYREAFKPDVAEIKSSLAGKDLACWCPLDRVCHADVLIGIANGDGA